MKIISHESANPSIDVKLDIDMSISDLIDRCHSEVKKDLETLVPEAFTLEDNWFFMTRSKFLEIPPDAWQISDRVEWNMIKIISNKNLVGALEMFDQLHLKIPSVIACCRNLNKHGHVCYKAYYRDEEGKRISSYVNSYTGNVVTNNVHYDDDAWGHETRDK
jgi:hypothetical protein